MINSLDVHKKIAHYEEKLELIGLRLAIELQKPFKQRSDRYLQFLTRERSVYEFAKSELESLLSNG